MSCSGSSTSPRPGRGRSRLTRAGMRRDPSARALMWDIVRQLVADGTTLLLTTQYLDEADQLAGRIALTGHMAEEEVAA